MVRILLAVALLLGSGTWSTVSAGHGHWGYGYGPHIGGNYYRHYVGYRPSFGYSYGGYRPYLGWGGGYNLYSSYGFNSFYPRTFAYSSYYAPTYLNYGYGGYYNGCQTNYYGSPYFNSFSYSYDAAPEYYYGPQAVQRFLGVPPVTNYGTGLAVNGNGGNAATIAATILNALKPALQQPQYQPASYQAAPEPPRAVVSVPTESLPMARSRARKMMELGDRYFAEQKYYDASLKYREAIQTAADLAEAHFRLGHAETALGRFPAAAEAYRQALAVNPNIDREGFRLDDLYGQASIAKKSHLEAAAEAALQAPHDTSYLLVVGIFLRYDNEPDRAVKFLRKAWENGDLAPHLAKYWNGEKTQDEVLVADKEI